MYDNCNAPDVLLLILAKTPELVLAMNGMERSDWSCNRKRQDECLMGDWETCFDCKPIPDSFAKTWASCIRLNTGECEKYAGSVRDAYINLNSLNNGRPQSGDRTQDKQDCSDLMPPLLKKMQMGHCTKVYALLLASYAKPSLMRCAKNPQYWVDACECEHQGFPASCSAYHDNGDPLNPEGETTTQANGPEKPWWETLAEELSRFIMGCNFKFTLLFKTFVSDAKGDLLIFYVVLLAYQVYTLLTASWLKKVLISVLCCLINFGDSF